MARLFKPKYPKRRLVRGPDGQKRYEVVRDRTGRPVYREARKWYIEYRDANDQLRRVPGFADKAATLQKAAELERLVEREQSGMIDRFAEHRKRPLLEHLNDWKAALLAKGNTEQHARRQHFRAKQIIEGCRFRAWADLSASRVQTFLAELRGEPHNLSIETTNAYLQAIKSFALWMVRDGRAPESPLAHLKGDNPQKDRRRQRRALSAEELTRLIQAAENGPERGGMPGPMRGMVYYLVAETGLRQNEVRTLTPEAFSLDDDPPTVTVKAAYSKHRRDDEIPLRPALAEALQPFVKATRPGQAVFPLPQDRHKVIDAFKADLEAARQDWIAEARSPDETTEREKSDFLRYRDQAGRYADFHALRHTFITNLAKAGTPPKVAMDLARHSDINLTLARYSHTVIQDRAAALHALPELGSRTSRQAGRIAKTGTDDEAGMAPAGERCISSCISKSVAGSAAPLASAGTASEMEAETGDAVSPCKTVGLASRGTERCAVGSTADGGIRTLNPSITNAVLYR